MPTKQSSKRSEKENAQVSQPTRKSKKADYLQFTENRYKRMSDAEFVKAFEEDSQDPADEIYTQMTGKLVHYFMANISREDRAELQEQVECGDANLLEWLESYPDLVDRLPSNTLLQLHLDEKLSLLIHHPEKADTLVPMLKGEDIWAIMLTRYCPSIRRIGIKVCPWETMTASQIRYMKLQSEPLKKFIESHNLG